MREWVVAAGLIEDDGRLLLVQNRRRDGSLDWSPPGGVIETGESMTDGLTREVEEETGLHVSSWSSPLYEVDVVAPDMDWHLAVAVFRAAAWDGALTTADPDGIVVDARWVPLGDCQGHLDGVHRWVAEPLGLWLAGSVAAAATGMPPPGFAYRVSGIDRASFAVVRV